MSKIGDNRSGMINQLGHSKIKDNIKKVGCQR